MYQGKKGAQNIGNKTVSENMATTLTEDGHKSNTKTSTPIQTKRAKKQWRPKKIWRDQLHFEDQGTGNTPNPSGT